MTSLAKLQRCVQGFVTDGEDATSCIKNPDGMTKQDRLQVYRSAYFLRLISVLNDQFPRLYALFGEKKFGLLVRDYLAQYPSKSPSLFDVGKLLAKYMLEDGGYTFAEIELAEVDCSMMQLSFCNSQKALSLADFKSLDPNEFATISFGLIDAHAFITLLHLNDDFKPRQQSQTEPLKVLLWRRELQVLYQVLDALENELLQLLARQIPFANVCAELTEKFPEAYVCKHLAVCLQRWVERGIIVNSN